MKEDANVSIEHAHMTTNILISDMKLVSNHFKSCIYVI